MRLLVVGDSHCRDLLKPLKLVDKHSTLMCVSVPSSIEDIAEHYDDKFADILAFDPSIAVVHLGHNDLSYHHVHNPNP